MDNDALSGLLNDPEALQNALRSVSSLLGASDADGAPDAVSPADDPEAQLLPVITGIMQSGRAAVRRTRNTAALPAPAIAAAP